VPHQQRQLPPGLLLQEILHIHLLDLVHTVRIDLRGHAARREHDLLHRLPGNLDLPPADMERADVA
jgi:hypothetical protein